MSGMGMNTPTIYERLLFWSVVVIGGFACYWFVGRFALALIAGSFG